MGLTEYPILPLTELTTDSYIELRDLLAESTYNGHYVFATLSAPFEPSGSFPTISIFHIFSFQ